jgi:type II secretory pathway pseudopilin PulG
MARDKSERKSIIMRLNLRKKIKAFSIIEIMAVVFIVTMGMVGMMNLIAQSIRVQRLNEHTLIAYQLAQEGIELVRVIRDDNWLAIEAEQQEFLTNLIPDNYCIDYSNVELGSAQASPCLLYLNANNFYVHESMNNTETPYSRLISIEQYDAKDHAVNVKVKITWEDVTGALEYEAETRLYDWY